MTIDPPGAKRRASWRMTSGHNLSGDLTSLVRYEVPIYDRQWQGSFVRGTVEGRSVVGVTNDWTTETDIYGAAAARNAGKL